MVFNDKFDIRLTTFRYLRRQPSNMKDNPLRGSLATKRQYYRIRIWKLRNSRNEKISLWNRPKLLSTCKMTPWRGVCRRSWLPEMGDQDRMQEKEMTDDDRKAWSLTFKAVVGHAMSHKSDTKSEWKRSGSSIWETTSVVWTCLEGTNAGLGRFF